MAYTITINSNSPQAKKLVHYLKSLDYVKVTNTTAKKKTTPKKKKSLLDIAKELAKKPLFTIDEKDRDLVYGSNMMTRLLQEEEI